MKTFKPNNRAEKEMMRRADDSVRQLQSYLRPYINDALGLFVLSAAKKGALRAALIKDVPLAVARYLVSGGMKKSYSFAAYFGWYIGERINEVPGLKRKKLRITKASR